MKNDLFRRFPMSCALTAIKGWTETMLQAGWSDVELNEKGLK